MTDAKQIRLDIRPHANGTGFVWVVQQTAPVLDLFISTGIFPSRVVALSDFQRCCDLLGWKNDITEVRAR